MLSFRRQQGVWVPIAWGATKIDRTGDTSEVAMITTPIAGGDMGAEGKLRITTLISATNNANTKTLRYKLGATTFMEASLTSNVQGYVQRTIANRGAQEFAGARWGRPR